jgi:hypothetical protein
MSSSISGQWKPTPSPVNSHLERSSGVASARTGKSAMGAACRVPSSNPTTSWLLVISRAIAFSASEERTPSLLKSHTMLRDKFDDLPLLARIAAARIYHFQRI